MIKLPVMKSFEHAAYPADDASLRKSVGSATNRPAKERKEQKKRENVFERWTTLRDREEGMTRNRQQIFPLRVPFATLGRRILRDKLYRRYVEHATRGQRRAVRMERGGRACRDARSFRALRRRQDGFDRGGLGSPNTPRTSAAHNSGSDGREDWGREGVVRRGTLSLDAPASPGRHPLRIPRAEIEPSDVQPRYPEA